MIPCTYCNYLLLNEDKLGDHMKKFHTEVDVDGQFVCDECHATFKKKKYLKIHVKKVHSGIRHICPECRSTFSTKHNLARHFKSTHKNKCPEAVDITKSYEQNGNRTNDVSSKVEYSDDVNNTMIIKQENNIAEKQ